MGKGATVKNSSNPEATGSKSQNFGKAGNNEPQQGKGRSKGAQSPGGHLTSPKDDAFGTATRFFTAKGPID